MEFAQIPAGAFMMGSETATASEAPLRKIVITKPFYIGKYEVTQEQWTQVMGSNPSHFKGAKNPVEMVSWNDCQTFLQKLTKTMPDQLFRLPTEAEWLYACRAGGAIAPGNLDEIAWYAANSDNQTHPVGQKKPNAWGLYDMHGNVCEWCQDWSGNDDPPATTDPVGPSSGTMRVLRGGAWNCQAVCCRSALRHVGDPSGRDRNDGVRVVLQTR